MTFLAPTILWGLVATAIPVIIHLISLRNTREVDFSTLRFVRALEHETIRRLRIRQWLLILVRTAIIAALVLMVARPVQPGWAPGWMAGELESRVVIILDNSASMAVNTDTGSLLERAQRQIKRIVAGFEGQTFLHLFQTSPLREVYSGQVTDPAVVAEALETIPQSNLRDRLWVRVDSVLNAVGGTEPIRECFLLSDFPTIPGKTFLASAADSAAPRQWRIYCLGQEEVVDNLSIREVAPVSPIKLPGHLLKLNTRIVNEGQQERRPVPIELYLNRERVGQVVSHFPKQRSKEFLFQAYPGKEGLIRGVVEIPADDFISDNRWTFELSIPDRITCQIAAWREADLYFIQTALESIDGGSRFLVLNSQVNQPQQFFLDGTDVLILQDPGVLPVSALEDIKAFLLRGGGVIWFGGEAPRENAADLEQTVLQRPSIRATKRLEGGSYLTVEVAAPDHPLLKDMDLNETQLPQVFGYHQVNTHRDQVTILRLNNGHPFLVESAALGGKLFYFTSPLDLRWNDLPLRGLLVPLLHRLLILLATDESTTAPVAVGATKVIPVEQDLINARWEVISPSGKRFLLVPDFNSETVNITQTEELGSYQVLADGEEVTAFSTHLSNYEHPSRRADKVALIAALGAGPARWIEPGSDLDQELKMIRHGRPLWRSFLGVLVVLILLESALGRVSPEALKPV